MFRDLSLVAKKRQIGGAAGMAAAILAGSGMAAQIGHNKSVADSRRAHSSCSLGSTFKRGGDERAGSSGSKNSVKDSKRFLRVEHGGSTSRHAKRVHIRRSR
jgi:hypothetical protein